jgi:probable phosphoglycerate mutase
MSLTRLYLVRHGENPANLTRTLSSLHVEWSLTEKGVEQARQTAEWFTGRGIQAVYSSPLKRAAETAAIIGARLGLPVTITEAFREIQAGLLELEPTSAEVWEQHDAILRAWRAGDHDRRFPGETGDDYHRLWGRMRAGLLDILVRHPGANVIIVGHGGQFSLTFGSLCPDEDPLLTRRIQSHNCSISELLVQPVDGEPVGRLIAWGRVDHLHGRAADLVSGLPRRDAESEPITAPASPSLPGQTPAGVRLDPSS